MGVQDRSESDHESTADTLLCVACGYDLQGLDGNGPCPECGTAIERSKRGDALAAADPSWLRRVYRGQLLIAGACLVVLLRIPTMVMVHWLVEDLVDAVDFVVGAGGVALFLVGIVGVTTLDPRQSLNEQPIALRRMTRVAAIAALFAIGFPAAIAVTGAPAAGLGRILGYLCSALLAFAAVTVTLYIACLARRIPDTVGSQRMRSLARAAAVIFTLAIVLDPFTDDPLRTWAEQARVGGVVMLGKVAAVVSAVMAIYLMRIWWKFRTPLRQCLSEASRTD